MFNKDFKTPAVYLDGISTFTTNAPIYVTVDSDTRHLVFEQRLLKKTPNANLSFDKIIKAEWVTEQDVRNSSVVGNAIVGGLIFGGLGAVVGAVSGTKKKSDTFFVINYTGNDGEIKAISLKPHGDLKILKLGKEIRKYVDINEPTGELEL